MAVSPNLTEIVTTTLRNRRGELADNFSNHNALLRRMKERGNIQLEGGGRALVEELEYQANSTFKYYQGYEALDISPSDVFSAAEFDWKQAAVSISMSGKEQRINSGRERSIPLVRSRIRNADRSMMNNLAVGIYSDGTGTSGQEIGGLQLLVADTPTAGTVGGINRANFSFWQNVSFDATTDGGAAASASNIQGYMNKVWIQLVRMLDHPDLIVADNNYFEFYWNSLQTIQRISSETRAAAGYETLAYYGPGGRADVEYDDACPTNHMYFLNTDYLHWRVHRDANMDLLPVVNSINQDASVQHLIFMGNLTLSNAALQGVLKD